MRGTTIDKVFARFASAAAKTTGSPIAFLLCGLVWVIWAATGPISHYSETWQPVINTGTTIVTFLMVFLIQNTQNRRRHGDPDEAGRTDPLLRRGGRFMGIEGLTDKELDILHAKCAKQAAEAQEILRKGSGGAGRPQAAAERAGQGAPGRRRGGVIGAAPSIL